MQLDGTIGFLGYGNMGQAIAGGLVAAGTIAPERIVALDQDSGKLAAAEAAGMRRAVTAVDLANDCDIVLLATKPQDMDAALREIAESDVASTLFISIAAGISIDFLQQRLGATARVVRVMPNTPSLVGAGAAALAFNAACSDTDRANATTIFNAIGIAETVDEAEMDAVTALSGSGPAYVFYFVECLVDAAQKLGLDEAQATRLAVQTALGAGKMLAESGEPASVLRERVTSRGGTTAAALGVLREGNLSGLVAAALEAARDRSRELGQ